ncbi:MAG: hypothetical protein ABL878_11295 [Burkholderiales bacterium]
MRKPDMSEREILLVRLAEFAARIRLNRRLVELGWAACAIFGLLALYETFKVTIGSAAVVAALAPILILAGVVVVPIAAWRFARPILLDCAAGQADLRAGLKDELKSAYWYARHPVSSPLVELLLSRAAGAIKLIDARAVFPVSLPPSIIVASSVAVAAASLMLISPRIHYPSAEASFEPAGDTAVSARPSVEGDGSLLSSETQPLAGKPGPGPKGLGRVQPMQLANELEHSADLAQKSTSISNSQSTVPESLRGGGTGQAARPQSEQMTPEVAQGILDRLLSLFDEKSAASTEISSRPAARVAQGDLSEEATRGNNPGNRSEGERALNALLRALSTGGTGDRQTVPGEGAGEEQRGRSNSGGGAMGRRLGLSQAGAGSQDPATGNPDGSIASDPVLGTPTLKLQTQLRRVGVRTGRIEDNDGSIDTFFSATQSQESALSYEAVVGRQTASKEEILEVRQLPLAYRAAVRNYFLTGHSREK